MKNSSSSEAIKKFAIALLGMWATINFIQAAFATLQLPAEPGMR